MAIYVANKQVMASSTPISLYLHLIQVKKQRDRPRTRAQKKSRDRSLCVCQALQPYQRSRGDVVSITVSISIMGRRQTGGEISEEGLGKVRRSGGRSGED